MFVFKVFNLKDVSNTILDALLEDRDKYYRGRFSPVDDMTCTKILRKV